jgi:hypothetical protein
MTSSSANSDPYLWAGPSSGSWNDGANWQDQTTDTTGSVPRGTNAVTFGVDTPALVALADDVVTGSGRSASLGLYGSLTLSGTFKTGALNLFLAYDPPDTYVNASLTVSGACNSLQAKSVAAAGNLEVNDGAAMSVARTYEIASGFPTPNNPARYEFDGISVDGAGSRLTIGGLLSTDNSSHITVTDGGYLEARRMTLTNPNRIAAYSVDAQSTIEVGTLGDAAAGTWTIDYGRVLTVDNGAPLSAPEFVDNGTIIDNGGLGLQGSPGDVTGSGRILIEAGALLTMGQGAAQLRVVFKVATLSCHWRAERRRSAQSFMASQRAIRFRWRGPASIARLGGVALWICSRVRPWWARSGWPASTKVIHSLSPIMSSPSRPPRAPPTRRPPCRVTTARRLVDKIRRKSRTTLADFRRFGRKERYQVSDSTH